MRSRPIMFVAVLGIILLPGAEVKAADLSKEGTYTDSFYGFGSFKGYAIGKNRSLSGFEEDGLHLGNGLFDHMTSHCFGTNDRVDDMREVRANCIHTDLDGDQIVTDNRSDKYPRDAKTTNGVGVMTTGTGKYTGITGTIKYTCRSDFKAPTDGTFFVTCANEGNYKLP
jgi:hypothetical protein